MYEQVTFAIARQDLATAARVIKEWKRKSPKDPWLWLAMAQYLEATDEWERAEATYVRLLQAVTHPKVMAQARHGIERIRNQQAQRREHDLAAACRQPGADQPALLFLDPLPAEARQEAAQKLAKLLQTDPYTARMILPGQQWRVFRVGKAGELEYLCQALQKQQIPAYSVRLNQLQNISMFQIKYVEHLSPQVAVICQNEAGQLGKITFSWPEVAQWAVGQVPIYESVVDLDNHGRLKRKQVTQDYAEILDLHLHERGTILRLCDRTYQYQQSIAFPIASESGVADQPTLTLTVSARWQQLKKHFRDQIAGPCRSDFKGFGENAREYVDLLPPFSYHLNLDRQTPEPWDGAFHLYSCVHFLRHIHPA